VLRANIAVLSCLLHAWKLIVENPSMVEARGVGVWDSQVVACSGDDILFALEAGI